MEEDQRLLERILDGVEDPRDLPFALLQDITNNFSEERKIGQGGFGEVYKGVLGERTVAIKKILINENTVDDRLFRREVANLMSFNHRNIVQFLGFCSANSEKAVQVYGSQKIIWANVLERLLCFEYIGYGSLDMYITDELRGLEWETRYQIITGICKGLCYLHMEKDIVHMNLKPSNILLRPHDEKYMVPTITGFALSRSNEKSHTIGRRFGTLRYLAPEYMETGKVTPAWDIYSLGFIIMELVTGYKDAPEIANVLRRWRHRWNKPPTHLQYQQVTRCINIAKRCIQRKGEARPSIMEIIHFLTEFESTFDQISPCLEQDDMLRINPLELRLPSELKNNISFLVELRNGTRNCSIVFKLELPSAQYIAQPAKGIVQPGSTCAVMITVQARHVHEHGQADNFIVQSMQVKSSEGFRDQDIIEYMFTNTSKFIDTVDVMVVYEPTNPQENCKSREEINMPAEEIHKLKYGEASSSTRTKNYLSPTWTMAITCQDLDRMTNGFSKERLLGHGAYGMVYKGVLDDGKVIAVKILKGHPGLAEDSFRNELQNLMRIQHQNIIRLVGYCSEKRERVVEYNGGLVVAFEQDRALCLEYMEGGTLEDLISDESCGLDWEARYKIIKGVCQGLKHLHTGSKDPIYHLDLKPPNILLDKDQIPKLGDFGLSRLLGSMTTFVTKTSSGTLGYMPPEYINAGGVISSKFDVFSLGIIIIQIIAGMEGYFKYKCIHTSAQAFIGYVTGNWSERVQENTMPKETLPEIQKCIEIALKCVEDNREKRPTISEIVEELNMIDLHRAPISG